MRVLVQQPCSISPSPVSEEPWQAWWWAGLVYKGSVEYINQKQNTALITEGREHGRALCKGKAFPLQGLVAPRHLSSTVPAWLPQSPVPEPL